MLRTLSGVAEREGARLLTESTWVRVPPPELSPSGRVAEGGRLHSGRAIVPHGCESRLGVHVDVAQWPERCVADALMPVRSRSSTPSCVATAGEVLVVAHLASTQDERVRFPPPALDGTVAQLEERRPETPEVISSTLVGPTPSAARSSPAERRSDTPEAPGAAPGAMTAHPPRASRSRRSPDTRETPGSIPGRRTQQQRRYEVMANRAGFYPADLRSSRSAGTVGGHPCGSSDV